MHAKGSDTKVRNSGRFRESQIKNVLAYLCYKFWGKALGIGFWEAFWGNVLGKVLEKRSGDEFWG